MEAIKKVSGKCMPLLIDDIDTDRIIPARFLRTVTFEGIGANVFYDERYDKDGKPVATFPMNRTEYNSAKIIAGGKNFGCGSSREHAPQAIKRAGFDAVMAESFAEIFFGNSTTLGLPCVVLKKEDIAEIAKAGSAEIDLEAKKVVAAGKSYDLSIPETARQALTNGTYDLLAELKTNAAAIKKVSANLPY